MRKLEKRVLTEETHTLTSAFCHSSITVAYSQGTLIKISGVQNRHTKSCTNLTQIKLWRGANPLEQRGQVEIFPALANLGRWRPFFSEDKLPGRTVRILAANFISLCRRAQFTFIGVAHKIFKRWLAQKSCAMYLNFPTWLSLPDC